MLKGAVSEATPRDREDGAPDALEELALLQESPAPPRRGRRSPLLSVLVAVAGAYLLATMWADFRYWVRSDTPRDLGRVEDIWRDGAFVDDFENLYVVVRGTPDVQHAARMTTEKGAFGYLRLREAGGSLFASVPREDQRPHDRFEGVFQGRTRRLGSRSDFPIVQQFFENEQIALTLEIAPSELRRAVQDGDAGLALRDREGRITLEGDDVIELVASRPEWTVQLGRSTWRSIADAEAAVAALGYPWVRLDRAGAHFHAFLVHAPGVSDVELRTALETGKSVPADNPDPKVGAAVLSRSATYVVSPDRLSATDREIAFEYGDNTTDTGWIARDGRLVPRALENGRLALPVDEVIATRVRRHVRVDPEGLVILVEERPADQRLSGILFLLVAVLVGVNVVSLAMSLRPRRA
jgi:hypothetical protein